MILKKLKTSLCEWVKDKPFIKKVYIYGSYARGCDHPNDIDVAIEINSGLETSFTTWFFKREELREDLQKKSNKYNFHLEHYDENTSSNVKQGLEQGNILVYSKEFNDSN